VPGVASSTGRPGTGGSAAGDLPNTRLDRRLLPPEDEVGAEMYELMRVLYPMCRSLTGNGVRETFRELGQHVPFEVKEVPTGTRVFDWAIPREWNVREAWIADKQGRRIVDFRDSNLHILGYSTPIRATVTLADLRDHLFTIPEHPDWIPWRTSYYQENWGFSIPHKQLALLTDREYVVCIDSSLDDGHLTYAELVLPGDVTDEILISSYVCHPSLCNDGISGIVLVTILAKYLLACSHRYTYRFLLSPGTIGPLTWLSANEDRLEYVKHGLVASCVGDRGKLTYKKTRRGDAEIDQAAANVLRHSGGDYAIEDFTPWGGDERQFCSPGFDLPVGSLMRTPPGAFPEYHTSADNLEFIQQESLGNSFEMYAAVLEVVEGNGTYVNENPKGEPQLGRRGLYRQISTGAPGEAEVAERALLWVLNLCDGEQTLLDVANRAGLPFAAIRAAADVLIEHGLLKDFTLDHDKQVGR
jgi:aminopeptidase-like protein